MLYSFGHVPSTLLRRSILISSICYSKAPSNMSQDIATEWPNVYNMLCTTILRAFGQLLHNISQHDPTMLQYVELNVTCSWPAPSQHRTTRPNNAAIFCVEILPAFGELLQITQHDPIMLRYVVEMLRAFGRGFFNPIAGGWFRGKHDIFTS